MGEKGRLYAQIPHPDFEEWPSSHKPALRQDIMEPHLDYRGGTALEIGAYLASFSHWLESLGYEVTAVERNAKYAAIAREVRDLWGRKFEVYRGLFSDLPNRKYDVVLALNIFHHSLKKQNTFELLDAFLGTLDCKLMFFEPHNPAEGQMANAYRKFSPEEFAQFIATKTGLTQIEQIGTERVRKIFKLKRP
jgi:2-polyprenyl-3-methyl-5-hydroxy-6-metoxy-1,4-benzoquinol methylase